MKTKEQIKRLAKLSKKTGLTFAEIAKGIELLRKALPTTKEVIENLRIRQKED